MNALPRMLARELLSRLAKAGVFVLVAINLARLITRDRSDRTAALLAVPTSAAPKNCPTWTPGNASSENYSDAACNTLDLPTFKVLHCESATVCGAGAFILRRKDTKACSREMAMRVAWESEFDKQLKAEIGPDAFTVVFSGPQRTTPSSWRHLGDCNYQIPYRLINPGNYTVTIVHTHSEFNAIQEKRHTWQRVINEKLLKEFPVAGCTEICRSYTVANVERMWSTLPVCDRVNPVQGVYLRSKEGSMVPREKQQYEAFKIPYFWVPVGCKFDQLFQNNDESHLCHNNNHSIKILGDSHMRIMWDVLDRRLARAGPLHDNNMQGDRTNFYVTDAALNKAWHHADPARNAPVGLRTMLEFAGRDGFLRWFSTDYPLDPAYNAETQTNDIDRKLADFDVVVFNVGTWLMAAMRDGGNFSASRYRAFLVNCAESMMEANRRRIAIGKDPLVFIWHGLSVYPIFETFSEDDKIKKDLRTPYRLKIWSDIAEGVFSKYPIRRLDNFELTLPFLYDTVDGAHYHRTPAVEAQADELLHKINLCNFHP
ncbi:hypothetical protein HDU83_005975 [Entophlyctis luteolus]|nr:hypothetical protein HDU83_005975 [Entophlyctis luteolus]